jgi:hypothetical protein
MEKEGDRQDLRKRTTAQEQLHNWIPAFAGMTRKYGNDSQATGMTTMPQG